MAPYCLFKQCLDGFHSSHFLALKASDISLRERNVEEEFSFLFLSFSNSSPWGKQHWVCPDGKANTPLEGFISIYEHHLKGGLRYPLPCNLYALIEVLGIHIVRLHPNGIRYLVTLCVFAHLQSCEFNMNAVKVMFHFTESEQWISMSPQTGFNFRETNMDSVKNWNNYFFFLQEPSNLELSRE
ncbi:hypothetical protein Nepgr_009632 [Nepenthes gracilis]|uniref:Uncharacterized protein n=1 Tax=Nepenthes gracilis TaxID=150966 RepID=A0AAD3SB51_NEPGR|nr:hypothetical protein Nepgr_009632 [Nepenthes gracilis]